MDLFFKAMQDYVLADGDIDDDGVELLNSAIFSDGEVDDDEMQLLRDLKDTAAGTCWAFDYLCSRCLE